ncbi:protein toll-like [Lycorma delicatula]|uniref:protein toll-like n=1 Tax=Lycorma delicatula TaxID=130591 RepID=UPI003F517195
MASSTPLSVKITFATYTADCTNEAMMELLALAQYESNSSTSHHYKTLENHSARINLIGNPLLCDSRNYHLKKFFEGTLTPEAYYLIDIISNNMFWTKAIRRFIDNLNNVTCLGGKSISELTVNEICPTSTAGVIIIISILTAILGLIVGLLIALYYRYNQEIKVWLYAHQMFLWLVTEDELDRDKLYDGFISYSHRDEDFAIKHLVPGLENGTPKFKLHLHYRDWIIGDYIPSQIARSVEYSRRTIVVLSPNFLESVWGKMEFKTAHSLALSMGRARVIVILYGDVGPADNLDPELKAYVSMSTYLKWGDLGFGISFDLLYLILPTYQKEYTTSFPKKFNKAAKYTGTKYR